LKHAPIGSVGQSYPGSDGKTYSGAAGIEGNVPVPAETVWFTDGAEYMQFGWCGTNNSSEPLTVFPNGGITGNPAIYGDTSGLDLQHTGRCNVLWCDGHATSPTPGYLLTPANDGAGLKYWTTEDD